MNKFKELRKMTYLSQQKFGDKYGIPLRTIQDWESEVRTPPPYVYELLKFKVEYDMEKFNTPD